MQNAQFIMQFLMHNGFLMRNGVGSCSHLTGLSEARCSGQ